MLRSPGSRIRTIQQHLWRHIVAICCTLSTLQRECNTLSPQSRRLGGLLYWRQRSEHSTPRFCDLECIQSRHSSLCKLFRRRYDTFQRRHCNEWPTRTARNRRCSVSDDGRSFTDNSMGCSGPHLATASFLGKWIRAGQYFNWRQDQRRRERGGADSYDLDQRRRPQFTFKWK